jgi:hypothetical protein
LAYAPTATVVPSADILTLNPLRSVVPSPRIFGPNCGHDVPYVVANAPGGGTIALPAVAIVVVVVPIALYTAALTFGVTVATAFTPPSTLKFLVPWTAFHDRKFVSLE